jgi:hypothetical protein
LVPANTQSVLIWMRRTPAAAHSIREAMRQQGIHRDRGGRVLAVAPLLDDADRVDDDVWSRLGHRAVEIRVESTSTPPMTRRGSNQESEA